MEFNFGVHAEMRKVQGVWEVSINLTDYADAIKSSSISLPLKNSNYDVVLHVSVFNCYLIVCKSVVFKWSLDLNIRNYV